MPYLLLILTTLFWSGNFVISRGMHNALPPVALSFWRWALACLILCLFGLHHLLAQRRLPCCHTAQSVQVPLHTARNSVHAGWCRMQ